MQHPRAPSCTANEDGYTSTSWHPWMEASPLDPRIIKITSGTMGTDPLVLAGLTIPGHDSRKQATGAQSAMDTDQGSSAPKTPGDKRETVKQCVLERVSWFPE